MLKPGDSAPPFDLSCAAGGRAGRLRLSQIDSEMVVLFFYPHDFSFICPTEVVGFHKAREEFAAEKTSIVAVSVDDAETHLRWARELGGIGYPLLADTDGALARAYGVFDEGAGLAMRATFILDAKRTIVYCVACPVNVGRSVSDTLRVVRAVRSGRMCPADWQPAGIAAPPLTTGSSSG
ncbi:MAG TPA: redoxin domain-containing protein [Candidatus Binataceae bacterium]|nr:redoxin domain-containing protein [Candidatus Binataceae bacterium]